MLGEKTLTVLETKRSGRESMNGGTRYSIGDMSRICHISKKALRYYDRIGLIVPKRQDCNNYRYYTDESLLTVPVIKYYKQMGFTLDEMRALIEGEANVCRAIQNSFLEKIKELEREQEEIRRKYTSVKDWCDLILEAEMVIDNNIRDVAIKYVEPVGLLSQWQPFDGDLKATIVNMEFTNFVEERGNEIAGPVILHFSSFQERVSAKPRLVQIMQKALKPCREEDSTRFGGCMMAACYHIGSHESLGATYEKIIAWADKRGYKMTGDCYERYVTDYWTTNNSAQFVMEVMLQLTR